MNMIDASKVEECLKLVRHYVRHNYKYLYVFDSYDDYVSHMLTKVLSVANKYDNNRSSFANFIFKVCENEVKMVIRQKATKKRQHVSVSLDALLDDTEGLSLVDMIADEHSDIDDFIDKDEARYVYKKLMPALSPIYKLVKVYNVKQIDVAKHFGITQGYVNNIIRREQQIINNTLKHKDIKVNCGKYKLLKQTVESIREDFSERIK